MGNPPSSRLLAGFQIDPPPKPFSAFLVILGPIGLRKHVIADEEATVPNRCKGIVKSVIFASPGISEHEIKRLARTVPSLSCS